MRRAQVRVERELDGTWTIAPDHLDRAAAYEQRQLRDRPVAIKTLSVVPIDRLERMDAATWLDRELASDQPVPLRDAGFGREVRAALAVRRQWLVEQDLADTEGSAIRLRGGALVALQRRELLRVGGELATETGKPFAEARPGDKVEGVIGRRIDLASGRYAVVERAHDFTLVPWRSVLERQVGKQASGIMRADGISWQFGRGRSGPQIS